MLHITNHQGNANQNHSEIPPHASQNGHSPEDKKVTLITQDVEKRVSSCNIGGGSGSATVENIMEGPYKIKNRNTV